MHATAEAVVVPAPVAPSIRAEPGATGRAEVSVREFLSFKLGREEYGIDILRVQEIRSFEQPTRIANAPPHLLGVLNLRGLIVPIADLRLKFELPRADYDGFTVVIVLNIGRRVVGMVVDSVSDVIELSAEQMRQMPEFSAAADASHLLALGAVEDRMLILMDIEQLMSSRELGLADAPVH